MKPNKPPRRHMRNRKPLPTVTELNELVTADLESGRLFWRTREGNKSWNTQRAGKEVRPSSTAFGGVRVRLGGQEYLIHRVLYKMAYGTEPDVIDHIDGDRKNNAIANLRSGTDTMNMRNKAAYKNNLSGTPNVQLDRGKWRVRFKVNGVTRNFGSFDRMEDAVKARDQAKIDLGFHPNHGRQSEGVST